MTHDTLTFGGACTIPMRAVPKQRPRSARFQKQVYMSKRYVQWKEQFAWHLRAAGIREPLTDPFGLDIVISFRLKGIGDIDNLAGAILDAGNGVAWADDKLCTSLNVEILRNTGSDNIQLTIGPRGPLSNPDKRAAGMAALLARKMYLEEQAR